MEQGCLVNGKGQIIQNSGFSENDFTLLEEQGYRYIRPATKGNFHYLYMDAPKKGIAITKGEKHEITGKMEFIAPVPVVAIQDKSEVEATCKKIDTSDFVSIALIKDKNLVKVMDDFLNQNKKAEEWTLAPGEFGNIIKFTGKFEGEEGSDFAINIIDLGMATYNLIAILIKSEVNIKLVGETLKKTFHEIGSNDFTS